MKDSSRLISLGGFFFGISVLVLFSSCGDSPMSARVPQAQNDDTVWEGKKLQEWRWDLRGFRNVQKCATASDALARAGKLAVDGLSKDVNDGSVFFVNVWAAQSLCKIGPDAKEALPALKTAVTRAQEQGKSHMGWRNFEPWGRAAIVLISGESEDHIQKITVFLEDSDDMVRYNTCCALRQLGSQAKSALPALYRAKHDNDKSVQDLASQAISAIEASQ
ncbi:MAG: HEAT repeat domain-containing protein [Thermoanaerobaculaceae bacterium]